MGAVGGSALPTATTKHVQVLWNWLLWKQYSTVLLKSNITAALSALQRPSASWPRIQLQGVGAAPHQPTSLGHAELVSLTRTQHAANSCCSCCGLLPLPQAACSTTLRVRRWSSCWSAALCANLRLLVPSLHEANSSMPTEACLLQEVLSPPGCRRPWPHPDSYATNSCCCCS